VWISVIVLDASDAKLPVLSFTRRELVIIFPDRFGSESLKRGPTKDSTVDIDRMVDEYYKLHNWKE
jgi:aldehyde:ferredoxin oxidoreductase